MDNNTSKKTKSLYRYSVISSIFGFILSSIAVTSLSIFWIAFALWIFFKIDTSSFSVSTVFLYFFSLLGYLVSSRAKRAIDKLKESSEGVNNKKLNQLRFFAKFGYITGAISILSIIPSFIIDMYWFFSEINF